MNRWVGIVSLRETAPPTPVHRIALAIEAASKRTAYALGDRQVPYARMRAALRRIAQVYAGRRAWGQWEYCVDLTGDFFDGGAPPQGLPAWLVADLRDILGQGAAARGAKPRQKAPERSAVFSHQPGSRRPQRTPRQTAEPDRIGHTSSAESVRRVPRRDRNLAARDIEYPPLVPPPQDLVAESGARVLAAVADIAGSWDSAGETVAWLGLAAEHRSHLYESRQAETVTPHVLGLLERLGATALDVIVLDAYAQWAQPQKVGEQATAHHRRRRAADLALGAWAADRQLPRMSLGEAQRPAPSVAEGVARQILGALSLVGEHETARRLVATVWPDLDRPTADIETVDPVSQAHAVFGKEELTFDFDEEGPDHQKVFRATARTRSGRAASCSAPTKKAARLAAAQALLDRYPHLVKAAVPRRRAQTAGAPVARPVPYARAPFGHRDATSDLATMFDLGHRADALLAQALTHTSWILENQGAVAAAHQRSNQLLAHHGSFVIGHLSAYTRARGAFARDLRLDEDDTRFHSSSDEDTARLGTAFALAEGLLTSRGESGTGRAAVSDAAQAVVAAAWRTRGPVLLRRRPVVLDEWLATLEHRHDPVTVLNAMSVACGITGDFEFRTSGPEHLKSYTATAVLQDTTGTTHRWEARPKGRGGKLEAKKATAQDILDILAAAASDGLLSALTSERRHLLTGLLRAQLAGLGSTTERQRTRIVARGDLGSDLLATGDTEAFLAWADRVGTLIGPRGLTVTEALGELYRRVIFDARQGPRSLLRRMAADQSADGASTIRRHAAAAVLRAANTGPWDKSVRDIVQDWWRGQAPDIAISLRDGMGNETFEPLPMHLGAVHETLKWCGEAAEAIGTSVDLELTVEKGMLHVWVGLPGIDVRAACDDFAHVLTRTLPYTDCLVDDDHVLLRLHSSPDLRALAPLAAAGLDAYVGSVAADEKQEDGEEDVACRRSIP